MRRPLARLVLTVLGLTLAVLSVNPIAGAATAGPNASGTASPAGVITNGTYRLDNVNSGLCLAYNVEGRGINRQEACDGGDYTIPWDVVNTSGNNYEIINEHNNQCVSIPGGSTADDQASFVEACTGGNYQIFTLVPSNSTVFAGAYQLVNVNSGKCLAVGGARKDLGALVIQWTCYQSGEFMWRLFN